MDTLGVEQGKLQYQEFIAFIENRLIDNIQMVYGDRANPKAMQELRNLVVSRNTTESPNFLKQLAIFTCPGMLIGGAIGLSFTLAGPILTALFVAVSVLVSVCVYCLYEKINQKLKPPIPLAFFAKESSEDFHKAQEPATSLWPISSIVAC